MFYAGTTQQSQVAQTVRVQELTQYNVYSWGRTNAYPEVVRQAILRSPTASACSVVMRKHVYGKGFQDFQGLWVNDSQPLNTFWLAMAKQLSTWNAVAVHCTLNEEGECAAYHVVPFEFLRNGYGEREGQVAVWNNWNGQAAQQTGNTQPTYYHLWRENKVQREAIIQQCEGGMQKFAGFIRILTLDHESEYPTPVLNPSAMAEAMAEAGATERRQALAQNGFEHATFAFVGVDDEELAKRIVDALQNAQGASNAGAMSVMSGAQLDDKGNLIAPIAFSNPPKHNSEGALNEEARASHNIRNAYGVPKFLFSHEDSSLFAQSGEAIKGAFELYNMHTQLQREAGVAFVNELMQDLPGGEMIPPLEVEPLTFDFNSGGANA